MSQESKKLVMFDFDGVLVNTIEWSFNTHKEYNQKLTRERFDSFSEVNFHEGLQKAIETDSHIVPENFHEKYEKNVLTLSLHDSIHKAIIDLASSYKLAIVSSSYNSHISQFLEKEKITEYFSDICGADFETSKIIKINNLLSKYSLEPHDAVYITDTLGDIKEAFKCNVQSIGVLWGQHDPKTLEKGNPAVIIDNPQDLAPAVHKVLNG